MGFLSVDEQEIMKGLRPILQQAIDRADWRINEFEDLVAHVAMILRWDLQKTTNVLRGDILRFAGNIEALAAGALVLLAVWLAVYIYREMKREGREREYHAERMRALRGADPNATSYDLVSLPAESNDLFDELAQASRSMRVGEIWIKKLRRTRPFSPVPLQEEKNQDDTCPSDLDSDIGGAPELGTESTMGMLIDEQEIVRGFRPVLQEAIKKIDGRIDELEVLVSHLAMHLKGSAEKITNNTEVFAKGALVLLAVWLVVHVYREIKREGRERECHAERMKALRRANKDDTTLCDSDSVLADSKDLVDELSQVDDGWKGFFRRILGLFL
ncbi:hypothetical protein BKA83DRAFT_23386 [Pisolithus microcarpus]|nr:hypothetical protein BKA83DRAFT_23386 [Pisolithus microcarpus]